VKNHVEFSISKWSDILARVSLLEHTTVLPIGGEGFVGEGLYSPQSLQLSAQVAKHLGSVFIEFH